MQPTHQGLSGTVYDVGVGLAAAHMAWQIGTVNIDDPADCHRKFVSNQWLGAAVFASIVAARAMGV